MRYCRGLLLVVLASTPMLHAGTVVIDFETFPDSTSIVDSTPITTQFPGLTFSNTTVLTAGISLNEFEFPPHSGSNVAFDDGGPITIAFVGPILNFGGFFTYSEPMTLAAFDSSSAEVASATSAFSSNLALSGDVGSSPNEFLSISFPNGISSVTITGDPAGGSFTMDDATYTSAVPEASSIFLLLTGTAGLLAFRKRLL